MDRLTFRILSNINDGASLGKYVKRLEITGLIVVVLMVFFTCGELVLFIWGVVLLQGIGMEFRDKIVKHCFNCRWVVWSRNSYLGPAEIASCVSLVL